MAVTVVVRTNRNYRKEIIQLATQKMKGDSRVIFLTGVAQPKARIRPLGSNEYSVTLPDSEQRYWDQLGQINICR